MNVYEVEPQASEAVRNNIARLLFKQRTSNGEKETYDKLLNGINLALRMEQPAYIVVAEINDEIVGVAFFNIGISLAQGGQYMWLNELYVQEHLRNQGIARKLLLHVIHWAEQTGIKSIELETGRNNSVTKHLYNSLGFYDIISNRYGFSF